MSKVIRGLLSCYYELSEHPRLIPMKLDLDRALAEVELSPDEWEAIRLRFLIDPIPPVRDRLNVAGDTRGRPPGGLTQTVLANFVFQDDISEQAKATRFSRLIASACSKLAAHLGPQYGDDAIPPT